MLLSNRRIKARWQLAAISGASVAIAVSAGVLATNVFSSSKVVNVPASLTSSHVRAAQFVSDRVGWALTQNSLARTTTGGSSWTPITPGGVAPSSIRAVFFIDAQHGWLVTEGPADAAGAANLLEYQTSNGGNSWTSHQVAPPSNVLGESAFGQGQIIFSDPEVGWILVRDASSPNFSFASLFLTKDGGATWTEKRAPFAGSATFINSSTGWLAGGPANSKLDVTTDGGSNWSAQPLPLPQSHDAGYAAYSAPTFINQRVGYLSVTFDDANPEVAWFKTTDGGSTWTLLREVARSSPSEIGVTDPTAVTPTGHLIAAVGRGSKIDTDGTQNSSGLPIDSGTSVTSLHFESDKHGLALVQGATCKTFKASCQTYSALFVTSSNGRSWQQLNP